LVGPTVDPLGDGFIRLLPDGFSVLLAPADEPPALKFEDPVPACPVVPLFIDPLGGAAPTPAVPLAPPLAPAPAPPAPPPLCANATVLVSASAAASNVTFIFIPVSLSAVVGEQTGAAADVPALTRMRLRARIGVRKSKFQTWNQYRSQFRRESAIGINASCKIDPYECGQSEIIRECSP
jgi:hypothetical protein